MPSNRANLKKHVLSIALRAQNALVDCIARDRFCRLHCAKLKKDLNKPPKNTPFEGQNGPKMKKNTWRRAHFGYKRVKIRAASTQTSQEMPTRALWGLFPRPQKMLLSIALRAEPTQQTKYVCIKYPLNSTLYSYRKRRQALS
jgi:hypothetical protein